MHQTMTIPPFSPFDCEEIVLGGDFNLVLDVQKDKKGGNPVTHKNSLKEVQNIANSLDLIDIWRVFNSDAKRFYLEEKESGNTLSLRLFLDQRKLKPSSHESRYFSRIQH